jgi:lactoylglutathione lyase
MNLNNDRIPGPRIGGVFRSAGMRIVFLRVAAIAMLTLSPASMPAASAADAPAAAGVALMGPALRSTDLDRSIRFYVDGLGMSVARKLEHGTSTEVILGAGGSAAQPMILLYQDHAPGQSPPIDHGNGFGRIVLRTPDAAALAARLAAAGFAPAEIQANPVNGRKVFWAADPDGYRYEIIEATAAPAK